MVGYLSSTLYITVERYALDQPGPEDLDTFYAGFSHHVAYVFNMILELFGSLHFGDELIQIRHDSHHSEKEQQGKSTPYPGAIIRIYSASVGI